MISNVIAERKRLQEMIEMRLIHRREIYLRIVYLQRSKLLQMHDRRKILQFLFLFLFFSLVRRLYYFRAFEIKIIHKIFFFLFTHNKIS